MLENLKISKKLSMMITFFENNLKVNAHNYMRYSSVHSENLNFDLFDNFEQHINPLNTDIIWKIGTNIIEDENNEIIDIKWTVYFDLLVKDSNYITYVISIPLFVLYSYFAINTQVCKKFVTMWKNYTCAIKIRCKNSYPSILKK